MTEIINCPDCTFQNSISIKENVKKCQVCEKDLFDLSPIMQNYKDAYESIPEFMVSRKMICLGGKINDFYLNFMVDTGCQSTCISYSLAKLCKIDHLINTQYEGVVNGVGQKKIIGKIFLSEILFDFGVMQTSFLVIEDDTKSEPIALLGLDVFFSHGCKIDFKNHIIEINDLIKIRF